MNATIDRRRKARTSFLDRFKTSTRFTCGLRWIAPAILGTPHQWRRFVEVMGVLAFRADTTTVRLLLAIASLGYGWRLTFDERVWGKPYYALISRAFVDRHIWASLFILHFLLVFWRFMDTRPRVYLGFVINAYGFALWSLYVLLTDFAVHDTAPGNAMASTVCMFALWALVRTGLNEEVISP